MVNGAIVVSGRSYGTSRTMVNRGPQLVQLMNGYSWRRSAGSASSRRQSAQVAVSAETRVRRSPVWLSLAAMTKDAERTGRRARVVTRSILASGGAWSSSRPRNSADRGFRPLDLGEHAVEVVADQPGQPQAGGERVDERAEADALHHPLDPDRRPDRVHVTSLGPDRSPAI